MLTEVSMHRIKPPPSMPWLKVYHELMTWSGIMWVSRGGRMLVEKGGALSHRINIRVKRRRQQARSLEDHCCYTVGLQTGCSLNLLAFSSTRYLTFFSSKFCSGTVQGIEGTIINCRVNKDMKRVTQHITNTKKFWNHWSIQVPQPGAYSKQGGMEQCCAGVWVPDEYKYGYEYFIIVPDPCEVFNYLNLMLHHYVEIQYLELEPESILVFCGY